MIHLLSSPSLYLFVLIQHFFSLLSTLKSWGLSLVFGPWTTLIMITKQVWIKLNEYERVILLVVGMGPQEVVSVSQTLHHQNLQLFSLSHSLSPHTASPPPVYMQTDTHFHSTVTENHSICMTLCVLVWYQN